MYQVVRRITLPAAVITAFLLSSCGNGLPPSSHVTARVTPAEATVAGGDAAALLGDATGFTDTAQIVVRWWVQEAHDAGGSDDCGYLLPPPTSPCQFGYVIFGSVSMFPSSATYHAPLTPGIYHVTFEATQFVEFDYLSKTAIATITVTP